MSQLEDAKPPASHREAERARARERDVCVCVCVCVCILVLLHVSSYSYTCIISMCLQTRAAAHLGEVGEYEGEVGL